ncbi:MAG TPA: OmpA family protein [Oscillatoriales cyanobacterium M59_W2019_021]|nr:OmpA family protein [Oscillatoriales cyanobacterium M4454_W2019_049]HIK52630.1 OmpA family protein [Oscillatoriales cyanobacterium M59_W2019_021]
MTEDRPSHPHIRDPHRAERADRELEALLTVLNAAIPEDPLRIAPTDGRTTPTPETILSSLETSPTTAMGGRLLRTLDRAGDPRSQPPTDRPPGRLQRLMTVLESTDNPLEDDRPAPPPVEVEDTPNIEPGALVVEDGDGTTLYLHRPDQWQSIHHQLDSLERQFQQLADRVGEPTDLINPLLPLISELLRTSATNTREGLCDAIVPILDEIVRKRSLQDRQSLSEALADLIPDAISQEIRNSPAQIASAIAPEVALAIEKQIHLDRDAIANALGSEMGKAIKAQIHLERDAMVDALYPVIGNTISKYMVEVIREINAKVENALSIEGLRRKMRARMQGVSEAELILRESVTYTVEAIFLIHKSSGLVIAETQKPRDERWESDMIAGMLTAIRSFANDCVAQSGHTSELHEIEYGNLQIILEVAGYCYLAVVVAGDPSKSFIEKMRQTLSTIVEDYDRPIQTYDGDPDTIPPAVTQAIEALMTPVIEPAEPPRKSAPWTLGILGGLLLLGVLIWGGRTLYHRHLATQALAAIEATPELAVYRLDAQMRRGRLQLSGKLPNAPLSALAERAVRQALPQTEIDNTILAVDVPPDPVLVDGEVQRLVAVFNRMAGVDISANYVDNQVRVWGQIGRSEVADRLTQALEGIPGVRSVAIVVRDRDFSEVKAIRIYFDSGSSRPISNGLDAKLDLVRQLLDLHPDRKLRVIGHSDRLGTQNVNQKLSRQRAEAVKALLVEQGVNPDRLDVEGMPQPPAGMSPNDPLSLSRCVRFEPLQSDAHGNEL